MDNTISPPAQTEQGPLPLLVGITGHRDLRSQDVAGLEEGVRGVLRELRARYPYTPLMILSPLGEGADRLVARVGLSEGARLCVPLPMSQSCYEDEFENDASRAEFAALLAQAAQVFTLPWMDGNTPECCEDSGPSGPRLAAQYAQMGAYIARHSQVFLALWDGDDSQRLLGGTAQTVRFRLEGAPPPFGPSQNLLDAADNGAVYHFVTPRQSHPLPQAEPISRHDLLPAGFDVAARDRALERFDQFNRDALTEPAKTQRDTSIGWLIPEKERESDALPLQNLREVLQTYGLADALAIYFQRCMTKTLERVFSLVLVAALCFNLFHSLPHGDHGAGHGTGAHGEAHGAATQSGDSHGAKASDSHAVQSHAPDSHAPPAAKDTHAKDTHAAPIAEAEISGGWNLASVPWFLWLYLLFVVVNVALHRRAERQEFQNKYQDYRALAEGMRVQIFWRLAALREEAADHYLGKQRSELDWIRNALRTIHVLATRETEDGQGSKRLEHLAFVRRQWVQEQKNYFVRKTHRELEELERCEKQINTLLALSVGLSIALALVLALPIFVPWAPLQNIKSLIELPLPHAVVMIFIVMLAVSAGLLHGYNQQTARSEHAKRYGRMAQLFDNADMHLERFLAANQMDRIEELLRELGKEALAENGDWVLLHRERPLQVPHAG